MKKTKLSRTLSAELREAIQAGVDAWTKAGELVVQMIDGGGVTVEEIVAEVGSEMVSAEVIYQFERIGRRQVLPALLVAPWPAARKLERLTYSEQQRLLKDGAEVVTEKADGTVDVRRVPVQEMDGKLCRQVFDRSGLRSLSSQRSWLDAQRTEREVGRIERQVKPWTVRRHEVVVMKPCSFSRSDLLAMLSEI